MTIHELKARLAERMEPLALALMATPPTMRAREELRFGRKGALAVRISGPKRGTWQDYSGNAGGDALDLGFVEIWDSQLSLFVIQALDGSLCIDGRPMGEDGTALPG